MTVLFALIGIFLGLLVGLLLPVAIPAALSLYAAVALAAIFSSLLGGIRASLQGEFSSPEFVSGLLGNVVLAVFMAWLGSRMDVPGYLVAFVYFGFRIFSDFNDIRRHVIGKFLRSD